MNDIRRHQEVLQKSLENHRAKTPAQRRAFLKEIGILDQDGNLAERYRTPVGPPESEPQANGT